jgi:hypothetical protein
METALKSKIDKVKRGLVLLENKMTQFYKPLNTNVRNIKTNFFEGSQECYIQFTYGFGPSEQTKRMEFPYVELEEYLDRFEDKKDLTGNFKLSKQIEEVEIMSEQKNNMASLRDYLFGAIEAVKQNKMTTEQARSTAQLAQTVINSVKLELDYKKSNSKAPQLPMLD